MNGREEKEYNKRCSIVEKISDKPKYICEWYNYLISQGLTEVSCDDYINKILLFLSSVNQNINEIRLSDICLQNVIDYMASKSMLNGAKSSDSYKQCIWSALNSFFDFCFKNHYIHRNYMADIKRPGNKDLARIKANRISLTEENYVDIINNVKNGVGTVKAKKIQEQMINRNLAIFMLLMTTGMRKSALCQINVEDIDLDAKKLIVTDKGNNTLEYILSKDTATYIKLWLIDRNNFKPNNSALLITNNGNRISNSAIDKLIDKYSSPVVGRHMSAHKFRSGFCSIGYKKTGNIEFVRRAVGHSNISTTQRYVVTENDERQKSADLINSIFE